MPSHLTKADSILDELFVRLPAESLTLKKLDTLVPLTSSHLAGPVIALFEPAEEEELSLLLRMAPQMGLGIYTLRSGRALDPSQNQGSKEGVVLLSLRRMAKPAEVDQANLSVRAWGGASLVEMARAVSSANLRCPMLPGALRQAPLEAALASNLPGPMTARYGWPRDQVMALRVMLPNGEVLRCGTRCFKDVTGYYSKDMFLGSENALGIILEANLRLIPKARSNSYLLFTLPFNEEFAGRLLSLPASAPRALAAFEILNSRSLELLGSPIPAHMQSGLEVQIFVALEGHADEVRFAQAWLQSWAKPAAIQQLEPAAAARYLQLGTAFGDDPLGESFLTSGKNLAQLVGRMETAQVNGRIRWLYRPLLGQMVFSPLLRNVREDLSPWLDWVNGYLEASKHSECRWSLGLRSGLSHLPPMDGLEGRIYSALKKRLDPQSLLNPGKLSSCVSEI
ncbi:MAG: FAD-binding oxidoreductase [Verrucomicrobiales bacterium]